MMEEWMNLNETAEYMGICRGAVYLALRKGKFPNAKTGSDGVWRINTSDVEEYEKNRYKREKDYDRAKGEISANEAAGKLGMPVQIVYYFLRTGLLKSTRKNWHYIVTKEELENFKKMRGIE